MSKALNNVLKLLSRKDVERDFGAVDSTSVDSGAELQAALDWVSADASRELEFRGADYVSSRQLVAHRARCVGRSTIKFTTLNSSTDCLVLQGSSSFASMSWEGININCNNVGRDGIALVGGKSGSNAADFYRLRGFRIVNAVRDGLHFEPGAATYWIEDFKVSDVRIETPGRHGLTMIVPAFTSTFINQGTFDNLEIRGAGRTTAGVDVYCDSQGSTSAQKISELTFIGCEFDAAGGVNHEQACISLNMTGLASAYDGWVFIGCTPEDVGSVITGSPYVIDINNSATVRGLYWRGGVVADYGYIVDPSLVSWCDIDCGSSSRRMVKRSMTSIGFSSSYANDAAAAAAGVPVGGEYRNGSIVQIRVS